MKEERPITPGRRTAPPGFRTGAVLFLGWLVLTKGWLLVKVSRASFLESFSYLLPDLAAGGLLLAAAALLHRGRSRHFRSGARLLLALAALGQGLVWGVTDRIGSVPGLDTFFYGLANLGELAPVLGAEIRFYHAFLLLVPLALLLVPWWDSRVGRRRGVPADRKIPSRPGRRTVTASALLAGAAWLLSLAAIPGHPTHPGLSRALLRSLLPTADRGFREGRMVTGLLPPPDRIHRAWRDRPADLRRPNFLFFFIESLRASATTPYNPELATTPFLAELARRSLLVERAYAVIPHTSPSLVAALCGYPPAFTHRVREDGVLPAPGLPGLLADLGYRSAFFEPSSEYFESRRLLLESVGFREYYAGESLDQRHERVNHFGLEDRAVTGPILGWLARDRSRPFLVATINLGTHHDYQTPSSHRWREFPLAQVPPGARAFQDYLNAVFHYDRVLKDLFGRLEKEGFLRDTVVFILGDHGEAFGEHGRRTHDDVLWEEGIHIPLLVVGPPEWIGPPRRITGLRQITDLVPTALDIMGVPGQRKHPYRALGTSLLGPPREVRRLYFSSHHPHSLLARLTGSAKEILHLRQDQLQCFDLQRDPGETRDLAPFLDPAAGRRIRQDLLDFRATVNGWYAAAEELRLDRLRREKPPEFALPGQVSFGRLIDLAGYSCPGRAQIGHNLPLRLVFRLRGRIEGKVRFHLQLEQFGRFRRPLCSPRLVDLPVREWRPGEWIVLDLKLQLHPVNFQVGPARLRFGLFDSLRGRYLRPFGKKGGKVPNLVELMPIQVLPLARPWLK